MIQTFHSFALVYSLLRVTAGDENSTTTMNEAGNIKKVSANDVLKQILGQSHDTRIRPSNYDEKGHIGPVNIDVQCYVRSMSNVDFVRMEYSLQLTFRQFWRDPRLAYVESFAGRKMPKFVIITQKDLIWTPDTFFLNEKQAHRHAIDKLNVMIRIHSDGSVMYSERLSLTLSCAMYLQKYPMDVQTCALYLASYAFTTDDIVYQWKDGVPVEYHPLLNTSLPNFALDPVRTARCSSSTTTGEYSCIQAVFTMKRMFNYYLAQVYIPSSLLVVVSWVSFWLDRCAVPARVTLGVTTLLTMTTQAASINSSLPAVSYIKAVDVWIGVCLAFIFATVLEYAYVSYRASMIECENEAAHESSCLAVIQGADAKKWISTPKSDSWGASNSGQLILLKENEVLKCASFGLGWWQNWKYGADPPKMIDLRSRVIFPVLFLVFNIVYWTGCWAL